MNYNTFKYISWIMCTVFLVIVVFFNPWFVLIGFLGILIGIIQPFL